MVDANPTKKDPVKDPSPNSSSNALPPQSNHEPHARYQQKVIGNYSLTESLGKGSMGKVKLGVHNVTGEKIAIKIVPRANFAQFKTNPGNKTAKQIAKEYAREENREMRTIREAHMMMLLRHPNIVGLKDLVVAGPYFYILMDYVNGGQLLHYIVKRQRLSEKRARSFARQIVSALDYMHRNSLVHRDLKIENILIDKAGRKIKIIDFGLSNLFCPERQLTTYCGSLYFAAPELLRATPYYGPEVDIWSLGVVIYVMVTGTVPFDDKSMPGLHEKIKKGEVNFPAHLSDDCVDLLRRIFITDPAQRIYLSDICLHPWMNLELPPIRNHLPVRAPLTLPLEAQTIDQMSHGMGLGTPEDIASKLDVIVQSPVYQDAAQLVHEHQVKPATLANDDTPPFYDDPQSIPAAYHPLVSVYHLTQERRLHALESGPVKRPTGSLSRKASVDSVASMGSNPGSQVSLPLDDPIHKAADHDPSRKINDIPLSHMVQPTKTGSSNVVMQSSDYLGRIQRWLRSSTSQHHLEDHATTSISTAASHHTTHTSPLTQHVTNALTDDDDTSSRPRSKPPSPSQDPTPTSSLEPTNLTAQPLQARSLLRKISLVMLRRGASHKSNKSNDSNGSSQHVPESSSNSNPSPISTPLLTASNANHPTIAAVQPPTPTFIPSSSGHGPGQLFKPSAPPSPTPMPSKSMALPASVIDRPLPPLPAAPSASTSTMNTPKLRTRNRSASTASASQTISNLSIKLGALLNRSTSYNKKSPKHSPTTSAN
ncbi:Pkinase-domain-containing protein [Hesseltinella vesiculosa]|uniref:non-specific serine/threonine protein kinase n=1 Tax=Hesseltinella vesiculosa TaxID=101127 RepID=A0A1X2GXC8_9FUNG|nr:Pkinase-domain-containing protein [Hesseltinella vesiculosa]